MTTARNRDRRGAALATAMLLTLLLLTLGMSFLTFCQRDLKFQRRQQASARAQNLARAGIEYWNYLDNLPGGPALPAFGASITKNVVPGEERFIIERQTTARHYISRGQVLDENGDVIAERAIFVRDYGYNGAQSYDMQL